MDAVPYRSTVPFMTSGGPAGRAGRQERRQRAVGSPGPVRTALFAAALALFAVAAPGASGAGWLPPANVSPAVPSSYQYDVLSLQDVAVDGQGNAIATWIQADIEEPEVVRAATRAPGGAWSGAVTIAADAEGKVDLKVAANAAGDAAIAWNGYRSGKEVVKVALRPAGGAWGAPLTLTDPDGVAREPDVVVDEAGNVTVAWAQRDGSTWSIRAATKPAGGDWGEPDVLSDSETTADSPQLAVDPQGGLTAVWLLQTGKGGEGVVQSTSRPPGGAWHAEPVDLSGPEPLATVPRVAVDAQGDATAVWQRKDKPGGSGFHYFVQSVRRVDGEWGEPETISKEDALAMSPEVAVDAAGNATAIWRFAPLFTGLPTGLQARSRTASGEWGDTVLVATRPGGQLEGSEGSLQLVVDPVGDVTAVWTGWSAQNEVVRSARLSHEGAWGAPVNVSPAASDSKWPRTAVDPQGYVTVVWSGYQAGRHAVRSSVFDPVPPVMGEIDLPATGVVGEPVAMSVEPFDVWSAVTTSWAFGDGGSAKGAAVEHCFSEPGEYTVTATGTDAAGNSASVEATIEIEPDPDAEPGAEACNPAPPPPPPPPQPSGNNPPSPATAGGDSGHNNLRPRRGCVVPRLKGMRLARARRALRAAGCRLGRVRAPRDKRLRRSLLVRSQRPRAGATSADGRVSVNLGPRPRRSR